MDISQSLSCISWHSHGCLPSLPGYQPILTFHSSLRLFLPISLNWFSYLHPFASQVTQSLGDLSYSTAFNCYLYAEDTLDLAPELLNSQSPAKPISADCGAPKALPTHHIWNWSCLHQTCKRKGVASSFQSYRIWNQNAWATSLAPSFGRKCTQLPQLITWSSPSLLFLPQSSRLWIPPLQSLSFPVATAFVQALFLPHLGIATASQLLVWPSSLVCSPPP